MTLSGQSPIFLGDSTVPNTDTPSEDSPEKIDWWIKCLRDEAIYVWLDLHVQRRLRRGDNVIGFDEIGNDIDGAVLKGYSYVNPSIEAAMKRFGDCYLGRLNEYTGLIYGNDPAIAAVLINNENDVTNHHASLLLPGKGARLHSAIFMRVTNTLATKHDLPGDKIWRACEHGPSKLFLNDLEHRFNVRMIRHLRQSGVRAPIVTTSSWGLNPLSSLPALTAGDIIDVHAYGGVGALSKNPLRAPNLTHWLAAGQVAGKPIMTRQRFSHCRLPHCCSGEPTSRKPARCSRSHRSRMTCSDDGSHHRTRFACEPRQRRESLSLPCPEHANWLGWRRARSPRGHSSTPILIGRQSKVT